MTKEIFAYTGVAITLISYTPYIIDIIKGKTTPHTYSWLIWSMLIITTTSIFFYNGGGPSTLIFLTNAVTTTAVFILSLFKGHKTITKTDKVFFCMALLAFVSWFFIKQPLLAAIISVTTSLLALGPTIRKSWDSPYSETLFTHNMNGVRSLLTFFSVSNYSLITILNPILWTIANFGLAIIILIRRSALNNKKD